MDLSVNWGRAIDSMMALLKRDGASARVVRVYTSVAPADCPKARTFSCVVKGSSVKSSANKAEVGITHGVATKGRNAFLDPFESEDQVLDSLISMISGTI